MKRALKRTAWILGILFGLFFGLIIVIGIVNPDFGKTAAELKHDRTADARRQAESKAKAQVDKADAAAKKRNEAQQRRADQRAAARLAEPVFALAGADQKVGTVFADPEYADGDHEALTKVRFNNYSCRWDDGQVRVTMMVTNPMAAHITVHLQPSYRLLNAGEHGDNFDSEQEIGVDAGATREWTERLDSPEGVSGTPMITACQPEINGIDLG